MAKKTRQELFFSLFSPFMRFLICGFIHAIQYVFTPHTICRTHMRHMPHVLTPFGARVCGIWSEVHTCTPFGVKNYTFKPKDGDVSYLLLM